MGTFRGTLTNCKEHGAGPLAAARACPAVAQDSPLLGHQVVLKSLDQQIFALRVVTHQQLRIDVAHQEVSPQQRQPHALHQLGGGGVHTARVWGGQWMQIEALLGWKARKNICKDILTHPRHMLPASVYVVFHPAQHSAVHLLF